MSEQSDLGLVAQALRDAESVEAVQGVLSGLSDDVLAAVKDASLASAGVELLPLVGDVLGTLVVVQEALAEAVDYGPDDPVSMRQMLELSSLTLATMMVEVEDVYANMLMLPFLVGLELTARKGVPVDLQMRGLDEMYVGRNAPVSAAQLVERLGLGG